MGGYLGVAAVVVQGPLFAAVDAADRQLLGLVEDRDRLVVLALAVLDDEFQIGPVPVDGQRCPSTAGTGVAASQSNRCSRRPLWPRYSSHRSRTYASSRSALAPMTRDPASSTSRPVPVVPARPPGPGCPVAPAGCRRGPGPAPVRPRSGPCLAWPGAGLSGSIPGLVCDLFGFRGLLWLPGRPIRVDGRAVPGGLAALRAGPVSVTFSGRPPGRSGSGGLFGGRGRCGVVR